MSKLYLVRLLRRWWILLTLRITDRPVPNITSDVLEQIFDGRGEFPGPCVQEEIEHDVELLQSLQEIVSKNSPRQAKSQLCNFHSDTPEIFKDVVAQLQITPLERPKVVRFSSPSGNFHLTHVGDMLWCVGIYSRVRDVLVVADALALVVLVFDFLDRYIYNNIDSPARDEALPELTAGIIVELSAGVGIPVCGPRAPDAVSAV